MVLANRNQTAYRNIGKRWKTKQIKLDDGSLVLLRPVRVGDCGKLIAFYESLSSETLFLRYFSRSPYIAEQELKRILTALENNALILVAESLMEEDSPIIAISEIIQVGSSDCGEGAVNVADEWQGKHLGRQMIDWLILLTKDRGITRLVGTMNIQNKKVLSLIHKSGYEYETSHYLNILTFTIFLALPNEPETAD